LWNERLKKRSAGILMYQRSPQGLRVLLMHPGGPFWANKDVGAWTIPKGEYSDEEPLACAKREFREELGAAAPTGEFLPLGEIVQTGGKKVTAWAVEGDFDAATVQSNSFELEWPPRSRRRQSFPEVDRAEWFTPDDARGKIIPAQRTLIDRLAAALEANEPPQRKR
jgi:predicted NUDIX family NTP pyrophosphohydrolase